MNNSVNIKIKLLSEKAVVPIRGSEGAAGYDIYADIKEDLEIAPHITKKVPTGIAIEIPNGYFGAVFPRSGLSTKKGLSLINSIGLIDEDYRGEIFIPIHNYGLLSQTIKPQERIAQLVILPYQVINFEVVDTLEETDRGNGGFGSTGTT